jgi:FtsH-binding integral membrane protein
MNYRNDSFRSPRIFEEEYVTIQAMNAFISKVFGWMFIGLLLTSVISYGIFSMAISGQYLGLIEFLYLSPFFYVILIGELILVWTFSAKITRLKYNTALTMFLLYSALNGVTLSFLLFVFESSSIISSLAITAVTFGVMCIYGYVTKTDLTRYRNILFMGLIGMIILSIVNIFLRSSGMDWFITIIGLFIFLGITAYDMQKLKSFYFGTEGNEVLRRNLGIFGALALYMDFVNLFLRILRIFGKKK